MRLLILLLIFFTSLSGLYSGVVVLVNGKLTNITNKKPIATKINFVSTENKVYTAASNSNDGTYQVVLQSGMDYYVVVEGWLPQAESRFITIAPHNEYAELGYDFQVEQLKKGITILSGNFFEKNSANIPADVKEKFHILKNLFKEQKGLSFEAVIKSSDSYFKSKKVKETYEHKGKKKTRMATVTSEIQLNELLDKRKQALMDILQEFEIPLKSVNIKTELIVLPSGKEKSRVKTKTKKKSISVEELFSENLSIKIDKVMKF